MKKAITFHSLILVILLITLSSCRVKSPTAARFYTLEYTTDTTISINPEQTPLPGSLQILPVEVYPAYSTNQIALRADSHEIQYFSFNQWAVRPELSIGRLIWDYYTHNNLFESLFPGQTNVDPDFLIQSTVYNIEVISEDRDYHAHLDVGFTIRRSGSSTTLVNYRNSRKVLLEERDLNLFAAAVSDLLIEELNHFNNTVRSNLQ